MWRRIVCSGLVLLACNCTAKKEETKSAPSVAPAQQVPALDAPTPTPPPLVVVDATPAKVIEGAYATQVDRYLGAYLDLLWADVYLTEILAAYPGAPSTNRYNSFTYQWKLPDLDKLEKAIHLAHEAAKLVNGANDTDRAILAYASQVEDLWPRLRALADYYKGQRYVDDEFAMGRRDAPLVAEAIAKIQPLRTKMIDGVFEGWREAAGDTKDSPRAIVGASFETCMRAAYVVFGRTKHADPKKLEEAERAIDAAMSACRQGVGAVSRLPLAFSTFNIWLRAAAVSFGNATAADWARKYAADDVEKLVREYIGAWPKLPASPAEKPERVE